MRRFYTTIIYLFVASLFPCLLFSQIEISLDSRGKDFWLTFLPNYHNNYRSSDPRQRFGDSLFIFIESQEPTRGTIEYRDRDGNEYVHDFTITDPSQVYVFKEPSNNFALLGFNESGVIIPDFLSQCEKVGVNSFHITSEKEVTVYALSQAFTTSEAFLVLPTDVLGNRYFILSYPSDSYVADSTSFTPSQFAIVATKDSTRVIIYPSKPTRVNGLRRQEIIINKGEVYLVQADIPKDTTDLTGTEIISNKPIAVFAGHQRAKLPIYSFIRYPNGSRDILIEQMPPVTTWGKNSIVVPFQKTSGETNNGHDIFRVLACEDSTDINIDGVRVATLNKGKYYERPLTRPYFISSSKPILVGAYRKTSGLSGTLRLGDPFFLVMPPVEQYISAYRVINAQAWEWSVIGINKLELRKVYEEQYISVIIPKANANSLLVDGNKPSVSFTDVPNSDYVYAIIKVSDGVHHLTADTTFGVIVYGYGYANSYGYLGGCSFLKLNFAEPKISIIDTDSCFVAKGYAKKYSKKDADLQSLIFIDSLMENVVLKEKNTTADSIYFSFQLQNIYEDGHFALYVRDTMGLESEILSYWIPGFTIAAEGYRNQNGVPFVADVTASTKEYCLPIKVENYGRFPQTIQSVYLKNSLIKPKNFAPFTIQPGETRSFDFCLSFSNDTTITDTVVFELKCGSKVVLAFELTFKPDKNNPTVMVRSDTCLRYFEILVTDSLRNDLGIGSVEIVEKENCKIEIIPNLPKKVYINVKVIEPSQDAKFLILVRDSAGNETKIEKIIPGYTIAMTKAGENTFEFNAFVGQILCREYQFYNFGNYPFVLDRLYFLKNANFSVTASNLPVVINPKDTVQVLVCFSPTTEGEILDTLYHYYNCNEVKIPFIGEGKGIDLQGNANCNVKLISKIRGSSNKILSSSTVYPNPAKTVIFIQPSLELGTINKIEIYNSFGQKFIEQDLAIDGLDDLVIELDISRIPSGIYNVVIRGSLGTANYNFIKE